MRIGIVNDGPTAVEALRRSLALRPEHQVAWVARDGNEAVEHCARDLPDLVLMDLVMPVMDGVEATRRIMAATPCAILVVTVSVGANAARVFDAMGHGALDAVDTPTIGVGDPAQGALPLLRKIETLGRLIGDSASSNTSFLTRKNQAAGERLVAIGASAGGPAALAEVLRGLPPNFPASVVIVQHVDAQFAQGLADWLQLQSNLPVRLASEGDRPSRGTVLVAGRDDHLVFLNPRSLGYTPHPVDLAYRPSADVFFQSLVDQWQGGAIGVLLTGMGRDGARGLKAMRDAGYHTIAQDRATSAVYGMPKAAADMQAAVEIMPLPQIAAALTQRFP